MSKSRRCKYGKLKTPSKTENGGKRMCKKKRSRKRKSSKKCKYNKLKTPTKYGRRCSKRCAKGKLKNPTKSGRICRKKSRSSYRMDNGPGKNYEQDYVRSTSQITSRTRSGGIVGTILSIPVGILELISNLLQGGVTKEELEDINSLSPEELDDILNNQQI